MGVSKTMTTCQKVKNAMLAVQRYPWEQGVCAQALLESADTAAFIAMAHDAVLRQAPDGRLAVTGENIAVTDPAANGEAVWRAYEHTGDELYKHAAENLLKYYSRKAPRTLQGLVCHNDISFAEGYSPQQIWADSCYMLPPFLAVMGEWGEAQKQLDGYLCCLSDPKTGLLFHIYDAGTGRFVRKKLWATGNAWALLGIGRMISLSKCEKIRGKYIKTGTELLNSMLKYQCKFGLFFDILDDTNSFEEGTSAMMTAAFIYRGIAENWLNRKYITNADLVYDNIHGGESSCKIDKYGIIRGVCGCPHFNSLGTSAEAQAAYIMMEHWRGVFPGQ
jgi:rhamnogalacturonyl hydrolase YesR